MGTTYIKRWLSMFQRPVSYGIPFSILQPMQAILSPISKPKIKDKHQNKKISLTPCPKGTTPFVFPLSHQFFSEEFHSPSYIPSPSTSIQHTHQAFDPIYTMETASDKVSSALLPSPLARSSCFSCSNSEQLLKQFYYSVLPEIPSLLWRCQTLPGCLPPLWRLAFPHGTPYPH